jgi:hypothetical protein
MVGLLQRATDFELEVEDGGHVKNELFVKEE